MELVRERGIDGFTLREVAVGQVCLTRSLPSLRRSAALVSASARRASALRGDVPAGVARTEART